MPRLTEEQIAEFQRLRAEGVPPAVLAYRFGLSRYAVEWRLKHLPAPPTRVERRAAPAVCDECGYPLFLCDICGDKRCMCKSGWAPVARHYDKGGRPYQLQVKEVRKPEGEKPGGLPAGD